jgi:hypothetical protein
MIIKPHLAGTDNQRELIGELSSGKGRRGLKFQWPPMAAFFKMVVFGHLHKLLSNKELKIISKRNKMAMWPLIIVRVQLYLLQPIRRSGPARHTEPDQAVKCQKLKAMSRNRFLEMDFSSLPRPVWCRSARDTY